MYASIKLSAITTILLFIGFILKGVNPAYSFLPVLPQLIAAIIISYYEYRHQTPIFKFPLALALPAIGAYIGTLFGFVAVLASASSINDGSSLAGVGFINAFAGFIKFGFIGAIVGIVMHFTKGK
ncbi:hypothetical protein OPS25_00020 [Alteromonas ponticola]|uniref:Uncharacterized protein n=1 Tax=Alteromonas aquimaris TaxID=2998417 RepID=A0ABT3P289_9ALTE|nr:hypothetical protein [Alteromonas aquimaris]MCW8106885.1 hypothetical protein [Alteromonas aquimaris]